MPIPIVSLSTAIRPTPYAATNLPITATTNSPAARPSTDGLNIASRSVAMPMETKKIGISTLPTAPRSFVIRSCPSTRPRARPAMNAPMMKASFVASATAANARMIMKATTTSVEPDFACRLTAAHEVRDEHQPDDRRRRRERPWQGRGFPSTVITPTDSPVTDFTTTVRITRPSTSSTTAAPSTMRDSGALSVPRSPNTLAVMPTLVAVGRGADEHRRLGRLPERQGDAEAGGERNHHPDDRDGGGYPTDPTQVDQIHLHSDEEEEQEYADFGEDTDRHATIAGQLHPTQHRRADDDAADDLTEHRRRTDAFGQFAADHRGPEHDEQVEQQPGEVDSLGRMQARWRLRLASMRVARRNAAFIDFEHRRNGYDPRR